MSGSSSLEALLKRDRLIVGAALALVTALAWMYLVWLARGMSMTDSTMPSMPDMPDMAGMAMHSAASHPWPPGEFLLTLLMWTVMMAGMMTPSAAPMILLYARVSRQATLQGKAFASSGWFAAGYLLSWTLFSIAATAAQSLLQRAALLTPMMDSASHRFGGGLLIVAGIYQWLPYKDACLRQCRAPLSFIQQHGGFKPDASGSLSLGVRHGFYCIGCCWALMSLLFVGGVMNLIWIAALAALVLVEKVAPVGRGIARTAGIAMVVAGVWFVLR
jgi:predicted metal-binding membrane protein